MKPGSKLRRNLAREFKAYTGVEAVPIENSCSNGLPDVYVINNKGVDFWVEIKVHPDRLSAPQKIRCLQLNAYILYLKDVTYTLTKIKADKTEQILLVTDQLHEVTTCLVKENEF